MIINLEYAVSVRWISVTEQVSTMTHVTCLRGRSEEVEVDWRVSVAPYQDHDIDDIYEFFKTNEFPPLDDICPQGYAKIISKCWNGQYDSIAVLQMDLDIVESDRIQGMTTGDEPVSGE